MRDKTRGLKIIGLIGLIIAFTINSILLIRKELQAFLYHPEWVLFKNLQFYFLLLILFLILCETIFSKKKIGEG